MKWLNALFKFLPRVSRLRDDLHAEAWYRSRQIWTNLLTLVGDVLAYFLGPAYGVTVDETTALAVGLAAVANIVMRLVSGRPLALRDIPKADADAAETNHY